MKAIFVLFLPVSIAMMVSCAINEQRLAPDVSKFISECLNSQDANIRLHAFMLLCDLGDDGKKIIEDFCASKSDNDWGDCGSGLRCKVWMPKTVYDNMPVSSKLCKDKKKEHKDYYIHIAIKNSSDSIMFIPVTKNDLAIENLIPDIETHIALGNWMIQEYQESLEMPIEKKPLSKDEIIEIEWYPFTSYSVFRSSGPGIYFAQAYYSLPDGQGKVYSNRICFAVLNRK
jgi:hypothetical protein